SSLANVVRVLIFLTDIREFHPVYKAWERRLGGAPLPFSAVEVPAPLPVPGATVMMEAWVWAGWCGNGGTAQGYSDEAFGRERAGRCVAMSRLDESEPLPSQRHLFDIPDDVAFLNCAYISPLPKASVAAGEAGVRRKSRPWTIAPADFFSTSEAVRTLFAGL